MKKFDKDDLKKNIKENLNQKKKKKDSKDDSLTVNGNGTIHHNSNNSLDSLSPYNRSPMGPSPSVSMVSMATRETFPFDLLFKFYSIQRIFVQV